MARRSLQKPVAVAKRRIILAMSVIVLMMIGPASRKLIAQDFIAYDTLTYQLYMQGKWIELTRSGKEALESGLDYYYLRMRIGVAYYEQGKFMASQRHFKKALSFNGADPVASEYLYYAYLLAGQPEQALLMWEKLPLSVREKIREPALKPMDRIGVEYLYAQTGTDDLIADPDRTFTPVTYGAQYLTRKYHNLNLSFRHGLSPGLVLRHGYTYLNKQNYYYYNDTVAPFTYDEQKVRQQQYWFSPSISFSGNWTLRPAIHVLRIRYEIPYLNSAGAGPGTRQVGILDESTRQFAGGLTLSKAAGRINAKAGAAFSNLNEARQMTFSGSLTWFPLGNPDLYLGGQVNYHTPDVEAGTYSIIPDLMIGYGFGQKLWIELSGSYGEMKYYTEANTNIVYNGLDWMRYKALATVSIPVSKKGSVLYFGSRFAAYESQALVFDPALSERNSLTYNSITFYGGLSWKF